MKRVVAIVLVISLAVGVAILLRVSDGNMAIVVPPYRIDLSINLAAALALGAFVVAYLLIQAVLHALRLPARVRRFRAQRRRDRSASALRDSLLAMYEGRYGQAERLAERIRAEPMLAGVGALIAARAAQAASASQRRDRWLSLAEETADTRTAARIVGAEFALDDGRLVEALDAIEAAGSPGRRNVHAQRLALRAYDARQDWPRLLSVLRDLERRDAIPAAQSKGLKIRAYRELFRQRADDSSGVRELLKSLTAADKAEPAIVESAADALVGVGEGARAARLIEPVLDEQPVPRLVALYARLDAVPVRDRMRAIEAWINRHGDDPALLAALGALCSAEGLWGKAEEYLRRADQQGAEPGARIALADLLERVGRTDEAAELNRAIARATPALLPVPQSKPA